MKKEKILITGATGGLGEVISELFLRHELPVIGLSRGTRKDASERLEVLAQKHQTSYTPLSIDFSHPDHLKQELEEQSILKKATDISHVIICHGALFNAPIHTIEWSMIEKSMRVNFGGPFILAQYFVKKWIEESNNEKQDRSLVYVSSVATKGGAPAEVAYHSAKRAMESTMLSYTREGAPYGIRANVVSPGLMDTDMGKQTASERPDVLKRIPLGKLTGVQEVARMIYFLTQSPSTTGQNIHINGGRYFTV